MSGVFASFGSRSFVSSQPTAPATAERCSPLSARRCETPAREKSRAAASGSPLLSPSSIAAASAPSSPPTASRSRKERSEPRREKKPRSPPASDVSVITYATSSSAVSSSSIPSARAALSPSYDGVFSNGTGVQRRRTVLPARKSAVPSTVSRARTDIAVPSASVMRMSNPLL